MDLNREFEGRTAIVTGGSRGIGLATARLFAARGANLVLVGRSKASLDAVAIDGAVSVAGDVSDPATAAAAMAAAEAGFGGLDILANVAGAFPTALLEATDDALYAETIAANLTGSFNFCRAAVPLLRRRGGGAIVNVSSMAARFPTPGLSVYGAAKAGVEAFSRAVAVELAPAIRVNAVSAGPTLTETVESLMAADTTGAVDAVTRALPLGRLGTTDEIAEAILFLASDRASFITGQVLHANGGGVMI